MDHLNYNERESARAREINTIISKSQNVKTNEDVNKIIHDFYKKPEQKFKKGESCIRIYRGGKKQFVSIDNIFYKQETNSYLYEYSYFPSSDGFCYEEDLRKLSDNEKELKKKSIFNMPMDMCSLK